MTDELGPRAKRSLGQNFLQDRNIARKIVAALGIAPGDAVLEIGPGPGALTEFLLQARPGELILVEKDPYWAKERMRSGEGALSVIMADALTMPWESFAGSWKFVGNLPYNIASPLLWDICSRTPGLTRAVFMVQKEVGLRITAQPGTSAYGALTVWIQSFMRVRLEFIVPPHVFRPRPKVDSAVLSFEPLDFPAQNAVLTDDGNDGRRGRTERRHAFDPAGLADTLKACFQLRRKQLGTIARYFGNSSESLEEIGIDPRLRPENLSPSSFQLLANTRIFSRNH